MSKGTALERTIQFFREANYDVADVAFQVVKKTMDKRAEEVKSQERAAERSRPKRKRRAKAEVAEFGGSTTSTSAA